MPDLPNGSPDKTSWTEPEISGAIERIFAAGASEEGIRQIVDFMHSGVDGMSRVYVLETLSKIENRGVNPSAVSAFGKMMIDRGSISQRIYLLYVISEKKLGNLRSEQVKDEILKGLMAMKDRLAMMPVLDYVRGDPEFLQTCASALLDAGDPETLAELVSRRPELQAEFGPKLLERMEPAAVSKGGGSAKLLLRSLADQAEADGDLAQALCACMLTVLNDPDDRTAGARFFALAEKAGDTTFRGFWEELFSKKAQGILQEVAADAGLPEPDKRINLLIPIGNIGDLAANLAYFAPLADAHACKINAILPESRTNREVAALFAHPDVEYHFRERAWVYGHCKPWMATLTYTPGDINTVFWGERPAALYSKGPARHRFDAVRNSLGLSPDVASTDSRAWREGGDLKGKIDLALLDNAVILAPHSNSFRSRIADFTDHSAADLDVMWRHMIEQLLSIGKTVFVNGRNHEQVIEKFPGAILVDLSLVELLQAVDRAGSLVSERSGLLDLIAATDLDAHIASVYPADFLYGGSISDKPVETVTFDLNRETIAPQVEAWVRSRYPPTTRTRRKRR